MQTKNERKQIFYVSFNKIEQQITENPKNFLLNSRGQTKQIYFVNNLKLLKWTFIFFKRSIQYTIIVKQLDKKTAELIVFNEKLLNMLNAENTLNKNKKNSSFS